MTSIRGGVEKGLLHKLIKTHIVFDSSHTTFYQLALEDTWVKLNMRMCGWKPKETSLLHPISSSVPFVQDVGERESVALTGCLPCGYMVTGGMSD